MSNLFDFSKVDAAASNGKYLKPGMWRLTPTSVDLETPDKGNPRLNVTFAHSSGATLKEKFVLTPKALSRLQYLHEAWFGKKLEKAFGSISQIGEYFKKALLTKPKEMPMIVGGEEGNNGRVYARLPFTGFVVLREDLFEEGEFEPGTARYTEVVRKSNLVSANPTLSTNSAVLPDSDIPGSEVDDADEDDMPWN